jgi:hypothetical protein
MECPQLLTEAEVADWLGVPIEVVALWAREGKLLAAARTEGGQLLFYRWRIERDGAALAAFTPRPAHSRAKPSSSPAIPKLPCGCNPRRAPVRHCRNGAALNAALQLAELIAGAMPSDPLLRKLGGICREALARHLTPPVEAAKAPAPCPGANMAAPGFGQLPQIRSDAL